MTQNYTTKFTWQNTQ